MDVKEKLANNQLISKSVVTAKKAAPTVAFIAGAAGSVASLYLMWRTARKHDEVVSDAVDLIEAVREKKPEEVIDEETGKKKYVEDEDSLPIKEYRSALVKAYIQAGFKLGKLYAPVVVAEVASLGLMSLGYGTLNGRYISTLATCTMLEHEYARYRTNLIRDLGEDVDKQYRFGLKSKEIEYPELDAEGNQKLDKNGKPKVSKELEKVLEDGLEGYSGYARIFDKEHCKQFVGDAETGMATSWYNREYLIKQQDYFNMLLRYRPSHTVFLNEVYEALGYAPTKAGQVVGWHYDPTDPIGDNRIIFVPIEFYDESYRAKSVIIDFNVDGNVWGYL